MKTKLIVSLALLLLNGCASQYSQYYVALKQTQAAPLTAPTPRVVLDTVLPSLDSVQKYKYEPLGYALFYTYSSTANISEVNITGRSVGADLVICLVPRYISTDDVLVNVKHNIEMTSITQSNDYGSVRGTWGRLNYSSNGTSTTSTQGTYTTTEIRRCAKYLHGALFLRSLDSTSRVAIERHRSDSIAQITRELRDRRHHLGR